MRERPGCDAGWRHAHAGGRIGFTASDGIGGLIQAVQNRVTLRAVITDLHMPHMDGLAFVRALRRAMPDVPVVVASGRLEPVPAQEFRKLGVQVMLEKPFTQENLAVALQTALGVTGPLPLVER